MFRKKHHCNARSSLLAYRARFTTDILTQPMEEGGEPHDRLTSGSVSSSSLREDDFVLSVDKSLDTVDLRRQMIGYNLHDIGAVVELELEGNYGDDVKMRRRTDMDLK